MNAIAYQKISGIIFALVALAHLFRIVEGLPVAVGDWAVPMWVSYLGALVPGLLAVMAFRLTRG